MKLRLERRVFNKTNTIGKLYIDDVFFCYCLEDVVRDAKSKKVFGNTAIPYAIYKVILSLSNRFKKVLPEILKVTGFEGVRMHGGNTEADTLGCVLVAFHTDNKKVWDSASEELVEKLTGAKDITLEIIKVDKVKS